MPVTLKLVLLIVPCLALAGCTPFYGKKALIFSDSQIEIYRRQPITIDRHGSDRYHAMVRGVKYDHIIGNPPYYVWINDGREILFVTRSYANSEFLGGEVWSVSIDTGEVKVASLRDFPFGSRLNSKSSRWRDEVVAAEGVDDLKLRITLGDRVLESDIKLKPVPK
jgi:hypothetical protein